MNTHALKIESLDITIKKAGSIVSAITEFAKDLGYNNDRIEYLECRSRDGFIPYSYNFGGIGCVAFDSQDNVEIEGTGFENADNTLKEYWEYDAKTFAEENKLGTNLDTWTQDQLESFWEYRSSGTEASVLYSLDAMLTDVDNINFRFCICVKDSPYHREYDDIIDIDIKFKSIPELKRNLTKLLSNNDVQKFMYCLENAY